MSRIHWTLGITTSAAVEVAVAQGEREISVPADGQALESLLPCLQQALNEAGVTLHDITLVAVCTGPGSFTGLRIGVAFAKSLAQSRGLPIVAVSAYDVAEFHIEQLPVIVVAKGKKNYYYGRITTDAHSQPEFFLGDAESVERAVERVGRERGQPPLVVGGDFSTFAAGERARRVAQLGRRAYMTGRATSWRDIAIDYGQRPNAVINWEMRRPNAQEGQPFERRELQTDEGPASPA